jgi:hypothetical protein
VSPILSIASGTNGTMVITWPATVSSLYSLTRSSSVVGPWSNVSAQPVLTNGVYQTTVTSSGSAQFYQLNLQ